MTPVKIQGYSVLLDYGPAYHDYNQRIIKTLRKMEAEGRKRWTIKNVCSTLRMINRKVDLMNPKAVKTCISQMKKANGEPVSDSTKNKRSWNYDYFAKANGLTWERPKYKFDTKVPITPTREQAETIIASAPSQNTATYFRILLESGFEGEELHQTTEQDVDTEQGIITVEGHKQHRGRKFKLKKATAEMLRIYMSKRKRIHPFPKPSIMSDAWRTARKRASEKLSRKDLLKIPLKGLRNLSGVLLWEKTHDAWTVMYHMGHKKLDTTQHYLRAMTPQQATEQEYSSRAVKLGTLNTLKEIMELIEAGFKKETEADGYQIFRKPK